MSNNDHKDTWEGFTKFVLMGNSSCNINTCYSCFNFIIKFFMIVGSTKEDVSLEKRVALTPDSAKNIIGLGLKICIEKDYATHIGIKDEEFQKVGVDIKSSSKEILSSCNLLIKVNCPSENEINS